MFWSLNRYLGFPNRIYCETSFAMENLIKAYNGKCPCFVSVNRYETRDKAFMDMFPSDFDSTLSLRIPYKETNKLLDFTDKKDIDHFVTGSGGKGFHFYLLFEEEEVNDDSMSKMYSIQHSLKKNFSFQSADEPLFAKEALMIRIPTTRYVAFKKKGNKIEIINNGNYCRYIPDDDFRKGLSHVEKMLREPGVMPKKRKPKYKIDDIVDLIPDYKFRKKSDGFYNLDLDPAGILTPSVCSIGLPCLQKISLNKHPNHHERIELVAWLKIQGYRDIAINAFIKSLKWRDYNYKDTADNVASIKPRFPKCSWLRERYPDSCENCSLRKKK